MATLIDCLTKATAAKMLTEAESNFVVERARELAKVMPRREAEMAAAKSMVADGVAELDSIKHQLGVAKPMAQSQVILRTKSKDVAMAAMADETRAIIEQQGIEQAQALQGEESVMQAGQEKAEVAVLGKAPKEGREAAILEKVAALEKAPAERIDIYRKMQARLAEVVAQNQAEPEQTRHEKLLGAMGELNAMLKFLPAEVRGKVGGFFQLAKSGLGEKGLRSFFDKRLAMIERELERHLKKDYLEQIEGLLDKSKAKKAPSGISKSRIGDAQEVADIARTAAAMSSDEVAAELASIETQLSNPDLTPEELSKLGARSTIFTAFGDLKHQTAEQLSVAYDWLKETVAQGRATWGIKEEKRLEHVRGLSAGIVAGLPPVTKAGLAVVDRAPTRQQWLDSFELSHYSFSQFLGQILPNNPELVQRWSEEARRADNGAQDYARKAGDRLTKHLQEAIGSKSRIAMGKAIKHLKAVESTIKVGGEDISISRMEAIQFQLSWAQPDVREKMSNDGWKQEHIDQMEKLTADNVSQAMIEFLQQEYGKSFEAINPIYREMYGMNLPNIENYAPTRYNHQGAENELDLFGGPLATSGVTPTFLKTRVKHSASIRQTDALVVYHQHLAQQAHWIHYAQLLREMRGVLGNPEVKKALLQKYGSPLVGDLNKWIDALSRQGGAKANELAVSNFFLDMLISAKAISSLGLNPRTVAMQADSAMRATLSLPTSRIIQALTDPKFLSTLPTAFHSDTIQRRLMGGASPEARFLFDKVNAKPSWLLELGRLSFVPIQVADAYLTSFSGAIVYRDAYNEAIQQGFDEAGAEAHAADAMDEAVYRYSQPTGLASKSLQEVSGGVWKKGVMLFMSDPRLKMALMWDALRGIATGQGDIRMHITRIVAVEAMAMLSQVIANIYRSIFSGDDDEDIWTWEGFALAGALAPISGSLIVGAVGSAAISELLNQRAWSPAGNPLMDAFQRGSQARKHLEDITNFSEPAKMIREWDNLARSIAFHPALAVPAIVVNALKPIFGAIENQKKED